MSEDTQTMQGQIQAMIDDAVARIVAHIDTKPDVVRARTLAHLENEVKELRAKVSYLEGRTLADELQAKSPTPGVLKARQWAEMAEPGYRVGDLDPELLTAVKSILSTRGLTIASNGEELVVWRPEDVLPTAPTMTRGFR